MDRIWQQEKILSIEKNLLITTGDLIKNRKSSSSHRISDQEATQLQKSAQLQFQLLPIAERTGFLQRIGRLFSASEIKESIARQDIAQNILMMLTQTSVEKLVLTPFKEILDDKRLIAILKCAGGQLLSLNISHCTLVTSSILPVIATYCYNLRRFKARSLSWRTATIEHLTNLKQLDLSQSQLKTLTLNHLPQLTRLQFRQCRQLTKLKGISYYVMPKWTIEYKPQLWVDSLDFSYQQEYKKKSSLFDFARQSLVSKKKILDLSKIELINEEFQYLCWLISLNLPFAELKIGNIFGMTKWLIKNENINDNNYCKIIFFGDSYMGKTPIYCHFFQEEYKDWWTWNSGGFNTRVAPFELGNTKYGLSVWDIGAVTRGHALVKAHCSPSNSIYAVFCSADGDPEADYYRFENIKDIWIKTLEENITKNSIILLVHIFNKNNYHLGLDCKQMKNIFDQTKKYKNYAHENNFPYFDCILNPSFEFGRTQRFNRFDYRDAGIDQFFNFAAFLTVKMVDSKKTGKAFTRMDAYKAYQQRGIFTNALRNNDYLVSLDYNKYLVPMSDKETIVDLIARNRNLAGLNSEDKHTETKLETKITPLIDDFTKNLDTPDNKNSPAEDFYYSSDQSFSISPDPFNIISEPMLEVKKIAVLDEKINIVLPINIREMSSFSSIINQTEPLKRDEIKTEHTLSIKTLSQPTNLTAVWKEALKEFKLDSSNPKALQVSQQNLKQLCLTLQYQQRSLHRTQTQPKAEDKQSASQIYIQSHTELRQYHDLLSQTLEFSIKAALLGVTGRLTMTNTIDTLVGGVGGAVGAVPVFGSHKSTVCCNAVS